MFTVIEPKDSKVGFKVTTQQYVTGLYVLIETIDPKTGATAILKQYVSKLSEEEHHKRLAKNKKRNNR